MGSPEYLSPEQIEDGLITRRTDIYSLGVLLHEVLTGTHPFAHLAPVERLERQLHAPLPLLHERYPELPAAIDDVIQQVTAKPPDDCYPNIASMVAAWQHAVAPHDDATAWLHDSSGIIPASNDLTSFIADTTAASDLTVADLATLENPYKGLRSFSAADTADFGPLVKHPHGTRAICPHPNKKLDWEMICNYSCRASGPRHNNLHSIASQKAPLSRLFM